MTLLGHSVGKRELKGYVTFVPGSLPFKKLMECSNPTLQ